nr:ATP synthase F1 subunit epsilon [uncultured Agathobaculum sp.]
MAGFHLTIRTPSRCCYDGTAERLIVRTTQGDVGILPGHAPYMGALGVGRLIVRQNGKSRSAAVMGGLIEVLPSEAVVLAGEFAWVEEIDPARARAEAQRAAALQEQSRAAQDVLRYTRVCLELIAKK